MPLRKRSGRQTIIWSPFRVENFYYIQFNILKWKKIYLRASKKKFFVFFFFYLIINIRRAATRLDFETIIIHANEQKILLFTRETERAYICHIYMHSYMHAFQYIFYYMYDSSSHRRNSIYTHIYAYISILTYIAIIIKSERKYTYIRSIKKENFIKIKNIYIYMKCNNMHIYIWTARE